MRKGWEKLCNFLTDVLSKTIFPLMLPHQYNPKVHQKIKINTILIGMYSRF